jgi:hypothetical protein
MRGEEGLLSTMLQQARGQNENGALNIVSAGLWFSLKGAAGEAVKGNPERGKAIPGAGATQLTLKPKR